MIAKASRAWANVELTLAACLAGAITVLIMLNVITRAFSVALYWVDEAAIYAMIWMTFLAASAALHSGHAVAVTVVKDFLPAKLQSWVAKFVDIVVFVFSLSMLWFCWLWFLPFDLWQSGFDLAVFQSNTFNFIYAEPTNTLGIRKIWVWSIMGFFSLGVFLHSVNNLLDFSVGEDRGQ